jgi:hypothetical protein
MFGINQWEILVIIVLLVIPAGVLYLVLKRK